MGVSPTTKRGLLIGGTEGNFRFGRECRLLVESGPEYGNQEMREVCGILVHLQPTYHAVVAQVLCNPGFGYAEMFREAWPDGFASAASSATA